MPSISTIGENHFNTLVICYDDDMQDINNGPVPEIPDAEVEAKIKSQIVKDAEPGKWLWNIYRLFLIVWLVLMIILLLIGSSIPLLILAAWPLVIVLWLSFIGLATTSLVGIFMFTTQRKKIIAACTLIACIVVRFI